MAVPRAIPADGVILAIDFGTSNTAAVLSGPDGLIRPIRLGARSDLMPSAVMLTPNGFLVGDVAVQNAAVDPASFEASPKRRLLDGDVVLGGQMVPATTLVSEVLKDAIGRAHRLTREPFAAAVLTHPDRWGPATRQQLRDAALSAGIPAEKLHFVSEAQAAAWHYATNHAPLAVGERFAVLDYGAGTCDVAVLEKTSDGFQVLIADGLEGLGGNDIDARVWEWVRAQLMASYPELAHELTDPGNLRFQLNLADRIREAKEALSVASTASIAVSGRSGDAVLNLTRSEFNALITPDIARAVQLARATFEIAGLPSPNRIYLAGGTSLIPFLHGHLANLAPIETLDDPKTVVARGAIAAIRRPTTPRPIREDGTTPVRRRKARWIAAAAVAAIVVSVTAWAVSGSGDDNRRTGATGTTAASAPVDMTACDGLDADECSLAKKLPAAIADSYRCASDPQFKEVAAYFRFGVVCAPKDAAMPRLTIAQGHNAEAAEKFLQEYYLGQLNRGAVESTFPKPLSTIHWSGTAGEGELVSSGIVPPEFFLMWTYSGSGILIEAMTVAMTPEQLVEWWETNHKLQ